jgi:hypothetical protein
MSGLTEQEIAEGWIAWEGGECPVEPSTVVETRHRCGEEYTLANGPADDGYGRGPWCAGRWHWSCWTHGGERDGFSCPSGGSDIIAYRLVKP